MKLSFSALLSTVIATGSLIAPTASEQVIFLIDESGSMGLEQQAVKNNANAIFAALSDPSVALVAYGRNFSPSNARTITDFTSDATGFSAALSALTLSGGAEDAYTSMIQIATGNIPVGGQLSFVTTEPYCLIVISDERLDQGPATAQTVISALTATNGIFFPVTQYLSTADNSIVTATGGSSYSLAAFNADPQPVINDVITACAAAVSCPPPEIECLLSIDPVQVNTDIAVEDIVASASSTCGDVDVSLSDTSFATSDLHPVAATVTDSLGVTATCEVLVPVYDPSAGFVTGGGWYNSEPGWFKDDLAAEGKASFGFVSKYKKGATVRFRKRNWVDFPLKNITVLHSVFVHFISLLQTPTGNTQFVFKAGNLNFHASTFEWLVVTGSDYAKFKGSGTINGSGEYKFQIWAGDGDASGSSDTFRIRIWTEDSEGVETDVYDNGSDLALDGGKIQVHVPKTIGGNRSLRS